MLNTTACFNNNSLKNKLFLSMGGGGVALALIHVVKESLISTVFLDLVPNTVFFYN